jgi:hypothetical protein
VRSTNNETPVERKLRELFQHYGFIVKFLEDISREQDVLFFWHSFLANFVGFIVFSFTLGHNFPYPKIYFLGVG